MVIASGPPPPVPGSGRELTPRQPQPGDARMAVTASIPAAARNHAECLPRKDDRVILHLRAAASFRSSLLTGRSQSAPPAVAAQGAPLALGPRPPTAAVQPAAQVKRRYPAA